MDALPWDLLDSLGALAVALLVTYGVITRKLIWHKDHSEMKVDRDFWRDMALGLLGASEKLADSSEVTAKVLSSLPPGGVED